MIAILTAVRRWFLGPRHPSKSNGLGSGSRSLPIFPGPDESELLRAAAGTRSAISPQAASILGPSGQPHSITETTPRIVLVRPLGNLANRMIQHMVALTIAHQVSGAKISRIHLPEWGLEEPEAPEAPEPREVIRGNDFDLSGIVQRLNTDELRTVEIGGYVQNVRNFLDVGFYREVFQASVGAVGFGRDELLISIRTAEILTADYDPYVLIPILFYKDIVAQTGLKPVFFGQLSDCLYIDDLRKAFPEARFVHGTGVISDFEVIRASHNILLSVSTFAWCAAWLSNASKIIMPLSGLFNPVYAKYACGGLDLVPKIDSRYEFWLFPINTAVKQDAYRAAHAALAGRWRDVSVSEIENILRLRKEAKASLDAHRALFDEDYYLSQNSDLSYLHSKGLLKSGLDHYIAHGFYERRRSFRVERDYLQRYPDSAVSLANGEFIDLEHYHAERGVHLGYNAVTSEL